jgi:hypothetical protein
MMNVSFKPLEFDKSKDIFKQQLHVHAEYDTMHAFVSSSLIWLEWHEIIESRTAFIT